MKISNERIMSYLSLGTLLVAFALSILRNDLLHLEKGYAPHDTIFYLIFFLPLLLASYVISIVVLTKIIKPQNGFKRRYFLTLNFVLILPSLVCGTLTFVLVGLYVIL